MPAYSGTPLPKKLGIRPGSRTYIRNLPAEVRTELGTALAACDVTDALRRAVDFAIVFSRSRAELAATMGRIARWLTPTGMVWAAWPKKGSGEEGELDDRSVREVGLSVGLVDVKVCSVSEIWSALKFVRRVLDRPPKPS